MSVDITIDSFIATIVLNRPEAMNSIDPEARTAIREAWADLEFRSDVRVVVITGAGDRAFCTGSDLKKTMPPAESFAELTFGDHPSDAFLPPETFSKPLVCAINGFALGGGLELALSCDIRIASSNARFGLPEVKVGSIPGAGGTQRLPRVVGPSAAMHMLLTGELIDADTALVRGLISEITDPADLRERAEEIGARIAANAPLSVRAVKRLAKLGADVPVVNGIAMERHVFGVLRDTEDRIEGRTAFKEKRAPNYVGR
jgi:E-phenylitaconyl-CoA hydratase